MWFNDGLVIINRQLWISIKRSPQKLKNKRNEKELLKLVLLLV
ncbi:hypothetical protein H1P_460022 [Hyella patelloides LEGE 07179]|uniref:Uncharacterized protein n=1 Tax=Hyella patelloides LEGE 07179 TaxID=945734 RepID=A0A563VYJ4_9CYAN|nr:hypothetical protein H1P_460022 [Hyella patelloides LEGE 07179]